MVAGGFLVLGTLTMATLPNYFSCTDPPLPQRSLPRSDDHKDSSLEMEEMNSATPRTGTTGVWRGFCEEIWAKYHLQDSRDSSLLVHCRSCCCSALTPKWRNNCETSDSTKGVGEFSTVTHHQEFAGIFHFELKCHAAKKLISLYAVYVAIWWFFFPFNQPAFCQS